MELRGKEEIAITIQNMYRHGVVLLRADGTAIVAAIRFIHFGYQQRGVCPRAYKISLHAASSSK